MIHIDRGHFCAHNDSRKYMLAARDIGYGSIIDNPVQHAEVLELLKDKLVPGAKVLDVGSGSGYLTTCFAHMVGKNGSVVGVEHIPEIVNHASNVTTLHYPKLNKRIKFICGDGRLGYPEGGPYDVIHVGASSEVVPKSLVNQIKPGGMMMILIKDQKEWVPVCRAHFVHKSMDGKVTDEYKTYLNNDGQPLMKIEDQFKYWRYQYTSTPPPPHYEPPYS
ncbi:protein-L-isoaspartate(D-aspartate) O-methyltransferase-like isoform X5 [Diaphorina citri]|uniref:protein-L-isoaspartate(D-aspartate) O-methyltransferase n=1 Tax=Diaphorina citri TaxID=121845 RepID=A0A1S4E7G4_DIACI|nr:protein-L-isoaspartate(D-aspartate) O-methyltransferase-like isoform X5 [Diaphorina citri]